jgi:hypothetical protein
MHDYDKSSKWLIQHHGDALLRLAGVRDVASWRPLQAELVQPRRLPDGLLEVQLVGQTQPDLFVLELATYPERRVVEQLLRDTMLVFLDCGKMPEALVVILCPRGHFRVPTTAEVSSRQGWLSYQVRWKFVGLWTLPAEELLAAADPGLVPWVPLMQFSGPPEPLFQQCRAIIDQKARPEEQANLLAVTQVLARLRYNDQGLLALLGGRRPMLESPLIQELWAERTQQLLMRIIEARFGPLPPEVVTAVQAITANDRLEELAIQAARCPDLAAFREQLTIESRP